MKHLTTKELASAPSMNRSTSREVARNTERHDVTRSLIVNQHSAGKPKRLITHRVPTTYVEKAQLPKLHESRVVKRNINAHYS